MPAYDFKGSWADACVSQVQHSYTDERAEILSHLSELSCHITIDGSLKNLKRCAKLSSGGFIYFLPIPRLKQKHPEHFLSAALYFDALRLLENLRFKLVRGRFDR